MSAVVAYVPKIKKGSKHVITNCLFSLRKDETNDLFTIDEHDNIVVHLDGYAIIPRDEYEKETKGDTK